MYSHSRSVLFFLHQTHQWLMAFYPFLHPRTDFTEEKLNFVSIKLYQSEPSGTICLAYPPSPPPPNTHTHTTTMPFTNNADIGGFSLQDLQDLLKLKSRNSFFKKNTEYPTGNHYLSAEMADRLMLYAGMKRKHCRTK